MAIQNSQNILLQLPQNHIQIYSSKIVYFKQQSQNTITLLFSNDYAFQSFYEKSVYTIIIKNIVNNHTQLKFQLKDQLKFSIFQSILRNKLCQLGFDTQYQKLKQIGSGTTAKVYLIKRNKDEKLFAAKVISIKSSPQKQYLAFINQTKLLRTLNHPNIIHLQSVYISNKFLIAVLQYCQGGTLFNQLNNKIIRNKLDKWKVIQDITQGVEHMRCKRIVHRDLKLDNILIRINSDQTKDYVITDFGLGCWIGEKKIIYSKGGTPGYIAPEIFKATKGSCLLSHYSDVFSLGVIYHIIFLLLPVFTAKFGQSILENNKKGVYRIDTTMHRALPSAQLKLLQKSLQYNMEKRYSTRELLDQIIIPCNKRSNKRLSIQSASKDNIGGNKQTSMTFSHRGSLIKPNLSLQLKDQQGKKDKGIMNRIWSSIRKDNSLKKKDTSLTKRKQMKEFVD